MVFPDHRLTPRPQKRPRPAKKTQNCQKSLLSVLMGDPMSVALAIDHSMYVHQRTIRKVFRAPGQCVFQTRKLLPDHKNGPIWPKTSKSPTKLQFLHLTESSTVTYGQSSSVCNIGIIAKRSQNVNFYLQLVIKREKSTAERTRRHQISTATKYLWELLS